MLSIISKELAFADLDKTCAKQRARLSSCLKLALSHTAQLSFCLKVTCIVKDLNFVQNTVRNCAVAENWIKTFCTTVAQRAQLCRCIKFAPKHTAQLFFCFNLVYIIKDLRHVAKQGAQLLHYSKMASKDSAQLLIWGKF